MLGKIRKLKSILSQIPQIIRRLELMSEEIGNIECAQQEMAEKFQFLCSGGAQKYDEMRIPLSDRGFRVFSQWGEDGIIQYLVNHLPISRNVFIEFGVQNYTESNTRFLLKHNNWAGLVIDGDEKYVDYIKKDDIYWSYNLKVVCKFITADNINDIFRDNGISGDIGLLSIDIDGNDYWVWKAINSVKPDIVICEYNPRFGKDRAVTIPYDKDWSRFKVHPSGVYFGASIRALVELGREKGYALVGGERHAANVFFVRRELLNDYVRECSIDEAFFENMYHDGRRNGIVAGYTHEEEREIALSLPLVEVE